MDLRVIKTNAARLALLGVLAAGAAALFGFGEYRTFTFDHLVDHKDGLVALAEANPLLAPFAFVAAYLLLALFGLPGSTMLMVAAGLLFDFSYGLLMVVLASTLASSLAFVVFRYLFRSFVRTQVHRRFPDVEERLQREGLFFVFSLRLAPIVPYSATNLILAVSPVTFGTYFWVTLLAMFPRYLLYVYAGTQLGDVQELEDLYSPILVAVLTLLALLPWFLRFLVASRKSRSTRAPK